MKLQHFLVLVAVLHVLVLSTVIDAEISVTYIKGMTSTAEKPGIVNQAFAAISPSVGALAWYSPFLRTMYSYAPDDNALTKLVQELFHVHVDGTFDVTRSHKKFAYFSDPAFIGNVVATVMKCHREKLSPACFVEQWKSAIVPALVARKIRDREALNRVLSDMKQQSERLIKEQKTIARAIKKRATGPSQEEMTAMAGIAEQLHSLATQKSSAEHAIRRFSDALEGQDPVLTGTASAMLGELIAELMEQEQKNLRPHDLLNTIMLAILWKKANTLDDMRLYLDAVASTLGIAPAQLYQWPATMTPYTHDDYVRLKAVPEGNIAKLSIDDLIFMPRCFDIYENPLPPEVTMVGNALYKGISFPDCGETALRNIINSITYNHKRQEFDLDILKSLIGGSGAQSNRHTQNLFAFYTQYRNTQLITHDQAHNDWAIVVAEIPGVTYNKGGMCDIMGGFDNMLKVIRAIFPGVQQLSDITERLAPHGVDVAFESEQTAEDQGSNGAYKTIKIILHNRKHDASQVTLLWHFYPHHFQVEFPKRSDKQLFEKYRRAYKNMHEKQVWTLPIMLTYSSFAHSYAKHMEPVKSFMRCTCDDLMFYFLPANTVAEKYALSSSIAVSKVSLQYKKLVLMKVLLSLPEDIDTRLDFFLKQPQGADVALYTILPHLQGSLGATVATVAGLKRFNKVGDWLCSPAMLKAIVEPTDILRIMQILVADDTAESATLKAMPRLSDVLYTWALNEKTIASLAASSINVQGLLESLLDTPKPTDNPSKARLLDVLYRVLCTPAHLAKVQLTDKFLQKLIWYLTPKDPEKRRFVAALYDWALLPANLASMPITATPLGTLLQKELPIPTDPEELRFLQAVCSWATSPRNLACIQETFSVPTAQKLMDYSLPSHSTDFLEVTKAKLYDALVAAASRQEQ